MKAKRIKRIAAPLHPSDRSADLPPDDPWVKDPLVIRQFLQQHSHYEHLCNEVAYALTKLLTTASIRVATITWRAKTLESFLEKVSLRTYVKPFIEITDFAGVRVICYYPDDIPKIESIVRREFKVVEKEDKSQGMAVDRFGYNALHLLIRLGERASGARYDDLKGKVCEIQVRTVLQDAWATFSHHLMYKHENEIPDSLKREIHALAGALGTADTAFQAIRDKRDTYIKSVAESSGSNRLAKIGINLDSVAEYLTRRFPTKPAKSMENLGLWVSVLLQKGSTTLKDVDTLLSRTDKARTWYSQRIPSPPDSVYELARALLIVYKDVRAKSSLVPNHKRLLEEAARMTASEFQPVVPRRPLRGV